jgi:long-chain acyl-CoA synthetase
VEDDAMNPAAWVERHARRQPDEPALADGDRVHASWSEFATRMAGAATGLRDHFGLSPGDRVAASTVTRSPISCGAGRGRRSSRLPPW